MSNLSPPPTLYRHSGKFPPAALAAIPLALLAASLLGSLYGILEFLAQLIPEAKLSFIGVIGAIAACAFSLGVSSSYLLMRLKVRSIPAAIGLAALSALVAYYCSWFTWFASYCTYFHHTEAIPALLDPHNLYDYILVINEHGFFPLIDFIPKGTFLTLLWIAEFLGLLIGASGFARQRMIAKVFCEHCLTWGTKRHLMNLPNPSDGSIAQLKSDLAAGNLTYLTSPPTTPIGNFSWIAASLEGCPTCDNLQALSVIQSTITPAKKNKLKKITLLKRLLLTPDQTVSLALAAANVTIPLPLPPAIQTTDAAPKS